MKGKYKKFKTDCKTYMITMKLQNTNGGGKHPEKHITEAGTSPQNPPAKETWIIPLRHFYGTCFINITTELAENNTNN